MLFPAFPEAWLIIGVIYLAGFISGLVITKLSGKKDEPRRLTPVTYIDNYKMVRGCRKR